MPELPEVQRVVDTLRDLVTGATINRVDVQRSDVVRPCGHDLQRSLKNRTISSIDRRGKRIVFTLDNAERFYIHLGMTGRLTVADASLKIETHTHVIFNLRGKKPEPHSQMRFRDPRRFGGLFWLGFGDASSPMGPEPLSMSSRALAVQLLRTRRAIKSALLDQRLIAGLGNIYVDESLFRAGIHPLSRADELKSEQVRRLNRSIKFVLRRAIRHGGSTLRDYVDANGKAGAFQRLHRVYGREDKPCAGCKTPIVRIIVGGRSTHFCPRCQPMP